MKHFTIFLMSLVTATAASATEPISVRVGIAPRIVDGAPLRAAVTIDSNASLRVAAPVAGATLTARVRPLAEARVRSCFEERTTIAATAPVAGTVLVQAGTSTGLELDLLETYPLGLPPGTYELLISYAWGGVARSAPARFEVVAPAGTESSAYHEFSSVCAALVRGDASAAAPALTFARRNPDFAYNAGLLELAARRTEGDLRRAINEHLRASFTGRVVAAAAADDASIRLREEMVAEDARHREEAAKYLKTASAEEVEALQRLGSILDQSGFERHDAFLQRFPHSFLAPDVLHAMIVAVEEGLLPRGRAAAEREATLTAMRQRLFDEYPESVRAHQAGRRLAARQ